LAAYRLRSARQAGSGFLRQREKLVKTIKDVGPWALAAWLTISVAIAMLAGASLL